MSDVLSIPANFSRLSVNKRLDWAVAVHNAGRLEAAEAAYRNILADRPREANTLHLLGQLCLQTGRVEQAIEWISAALKDVKVFPEAQEALARCYQQQNRHADAIRHFQHSLRQRPKHAQTLAGLSFSLADAGEKAQAVLAITEALSLSPDQGDWHLHCAEWLADLNRPGEAVDHYRQALAAGVVFASVYNNFGFALQASGDCKAAEQAYQQALELDPSFAHALSNLGGLWRQSGRREEALHCFQRATALAPDFADAWFNQAVSLMELKRTAEALPILRELCQTAPQRLDWQDVLADALAHLHHAEEALALRREIARQSQEPRHHLHLGGVLVDNGQADAARESFFFALRLCGSDNDRLSEILNGITNVYREKKSFDESVKFFHEIEASDLQSDYYRKRQCEEYILIYSLNKDKKLLDEGLILIKEVFRRDPNNSDILTLVSIFLWEQGRGEEALDAAAAAVRIGPDCFRALNYYGWLMFKLRRNKEALSLFERAWRINPDHEKNLANLVVCLITIGEAGRGWRMMYDARRLYDAQPALHSNLLFTAHFISGVSTADLYTLALEFAEQHEKPVMPPAAPRPSGSADKRLRVGFVSADFRHHAVAMFLEDVLAQFKNYPVDIHLFSTVEQCDAVSERFQALATAWHDILLLDNDQAAERVRQAEIDILVDLAGHTSGNRLPVFARRPAPVQVSWLGYFATTGLASMDYLIGDPICTPPELAPFIRETIYRMPDGFACYRPPADAPAITPLPAMHRGYVTFISANQLAKLTDEVVELWAALLRRVPQSRLVLRALALIDPGIVERTQARFTRLGIAAARLNFADAYGFKDTLRTYAEQADIALDPFPCVGGTTTCEALWMGVPVVTLLGDRFAGRHSASHLTQVGRADMIATNQAHYLDIAAGLAADLPRLAAIRAGLRPAMAASPLCDAPRFAGHLHDALRSMWRKAVATGG